MNNHQSNNKIRKTCKKLKKAAKRFKPNLVRGEKAAESGSREKYKLLAPSFYM